MATWTAKDPDAVQDYVYTLPLDEGDSVASATFEKLGGDEGPIGFHNEAVYAAGQWWSGSFDYAKDQLFLKAL